MGGWVHVCVCVWVLCVCVCVCQNLYVCVNNNIFVRVYIVYFISVVIIYIIYFIYLAVGRLPEVHSVVITRRHHPFYTLVPERRIISLLSR